ncbi:MAG: tRNA (N(6)-L-threonylcarbamoyladenosine(37)-C(2))-methylthiotransferase MtaB [Oscillospiraceae bacterium]|jgi:threonylcarbamoyladenosine tRNA methylthiotransferase MtaB|nr:tRNA (N(6)-L-threonylcarbamoyladenosine(37)-C(2))-methylthiotransferase MtaB [Oscillospiraceae bacterium]
MPRSIYIHTLGCKANQYDAEQLAEILRRAGFGVCGADAVPDAVIVQTCAVTGEAERKCRQAVRRFRHRFPEAAIIVTGCMANLSPEAVKECLPEADFVIPKTETAHLPELITKVTKNAPEAEDKTARLPLQNMQQNIRHKSKAYLKIQDGCDRFCAYCIIPYARGAPASKPAEEIRRELEAAAAQGFRHVQLVGINLAAYGSDFADGTTLADAVRLCEQAAPFFPQSYSVSFGSLEPDLLTEELLAGIASPLLLPQFHISLQSGSDTVLRRMGRRYTAAEYAEVIHRVRRHFPAAVITTDVIVGFPGETEAEFKDTVRFVQKMGFGKVHAFPFSPREGTPAAAMPNQVPQEEKKKRVAALLV